MRRIIASLDFGSNELKLVVAEIVKKKLNVLSAVAVPSKGIKKGYIKDIEMTTKSLKDLFMRVNNELEVNIDKVIVNVPANYTEMTLARGSVKIDEETKVVKNNDIIDAMNKAVDKVIPENLYVVSVMPTSYLINGETVVKNPINMVASSLTVKSVIVTVPKTELNNIKTCLENVDVTPIDYIISPIADYYECKCEKTINDIGAVINIGEETTNISIFNHGVLTNLEVLDVGGLNIDNDIAFIYKVSRNDARFLKENLGNATTKFASNNETEVVTDRVGQTLSINQYEISEIIESRLADLINLIKKQINLLTKKEISYIMVLGGVSELTDFNLLIEDKFGNISNVSNVSELGVRNNKFSTCMGMIKYYNNKMKLKNIDFSILSIEEQELLGSANRKVNIKENSILGKIFGYFFDN